MLIGPINTVEMYEISKSSKDVCYREALTDFLQGLHRTTSTRKQKDEKNIGH